MIIASARRSFAEFGFFGASTATIAEGAGCSEAVLYRHFDSKIALLLEVVGEIAAELGATVADLRRTVDDPVEVLSAIARRLHGTPDGLGAIRIITLAVSASHEPGVREVLTATFAGVRRMLVELVEAGQAAGAIRSDIAAGDLAWMWHGLIVTGGIRLSVEPDDSEVGTTSAVAALASLSRGGAAGP